MGFMGIRGNRWHITNSHKRIFVLHKSSFYFLWEPKVGDCLILFLLHASSASYASYKYMYVHSDTTHPDRRTHSGVALLSRLRL